VACALLALTAHAQLPAAPNPSANAGSNEDNSRPSASSQSQMSQNPSPFLGSVPSGQATPETIKLTVLDAIDRGLKSNLGILLDAQSTRFARAARLRALSDLLPHVNGRVAESVQQINLAAFGIPVPPQLTSPIVGPFGVFDFRASVGSPILDLNALNKTRAASEDVRAAQFSYQEARETVVLVVANLYLQLLSSQSRVEAAQAQLATAEAVFKQAQDLRNSGVAAGIDVLRSQVQMQSRSQRLLSAQNDVEKQKLSLARVIGLPPGQAFVLADHMPMSTPRDISLENAIAEAMQNRNDYKRAASAVRSAELLKQAAVDRFLPTVRFDGDVGGIGPSPGSARETYSAALSLNVPIFQGGRTHAEVQEADATLNQRKSELADFRARLDAEVRSNFLDLQTAIKQFQVARVSVTLADQQLVQSRDRFASGVAGSLEVTQSEESVAAAADDYINSLYALNIAQALLARSTGQAEQRIRQFLGER